VRVSACVSVCVSMSACVQASMRWYMRARAHTQMHRCASTHRRSGPLQTSTGPSAHSCLSGRECSSPGPKHPAARQTQLTRRATRREQGQKDSETGQRTGGGSVWRGAVLHSRRTCRPRQGGHRTRTRCLRAPGCRESRAGP